MPHQQRWLLHNFSISQQSRRHCLLSGIWSHLCCSFQSALAMMFTPPFMTNAMTSDFLSSISPGWVMMFLDSNRTVFAFLSWLDLLGVVLAFWMSILEIFLSLLNHCQMVTDVTSKTFGKFFRSYSELLSKFGEISFQEYVNFWRYLSPGLLR